MSNKIMSIAEFKAFVERDDWVHEQSVDIIEETTRDIKKWDQDSERYEDVPIPHVWGAGVITSTLDGVTITYAEYFSYDEYEPDTLETTTDGPEAGWTIEGLTILDEDGDEMDADEYLSTDYLSDDFHKIDYSDLEIEKVIDIDLDKESEMETFTIKIDNAPSIRFTGELVASASSDHGGHPGGWEELSLYKTVKGKFICQHAYRTRYEDSTDDFSGAVCETLDEVKKFFGQSNLAKEIYEEAGIDNAVDVD